MTSKTPSVFCSDWTSKAEHLHAFCPSWRICVCVFFHKGLISEFVFLKNLSQFAMCFFVASQSDWDACDPKPSNSSLPFS